MDVVNRGMARTETSAHLPVVAAVLYKSMLEPMEGATTMDDSMAYSIISELPHDLSQLDNTPKKSAPVPQSFFSPELPRKMQNLFTGFGTPHSAPTSPSMVRRMSSDLKSMADTSTSTSLQDLTQGTLPVFQSELSSRVNNLFGGFGGTTTLDESPIKSNRLQQLETNMREVPMDASSPQQPSAGVAGVMGGKSKKSVTANAMPVFASELTKRVC